MTLADHITILTEEVRQLRREFAEIREPILRVALKKETRAQQAKRLGCCENTLRNRERRERIRLVAERLLA